MFHINKIETRVQAGNTTSVNVLQFTSSEIVHNQRALVSRSLKGTHSDIVTDILKNDLSCKKNLFIEESIGVKKYISPNIRPFDIIGLLTREAVSVKNKSPTFVFFENRVCMLCVYSMYVIYVCMYSIHILYACILCIPCMYVVYECSLCVQSMNAVYLK